MDLALVILATVSPLIALVWWVNNEDRRRHERRMKELEIERLKAVAKDRARQTIKREGEKE